MKELEKIIINYEAKSRFTSVEFTATDLSKDLNKWLKISRKTTAFSFVSKKLKLLLKSNGNSG
jgi:hypothetical protein